MVYNFPAMEMPSSEYFSPGSMICHNSEVWIVVSDSYGKRFVQMGLNNKESSMKDDLVKDGKDAAVRAGATQLSKLVKGPLAALIAKQSNMKEEDMVKFFSSTTGDAMVRAVLHLCLSMPGIPKDDRVALLSRELRISAMDRGMETIADKLLDPIREVVVNAISSPQVSALLEEKNSEPAPFDLAKDREEVKQ